MARKSLDPDRFLSDRNGTYYYKRRIPAAVVDLDGRGREIRQSLRTGDLARARVMRDALEAADHELWGSLLGGDSADEAHARYHTAVRRAAALGYVYRPAGELAAAESAAAILERIETAILRGGAGRSLDRALDAVLGGVDRPVVSVTSATKVYFDEITPHQIAKKSAGQRRRWKTIKEQSFSTFVDVVGDIAMTEISRDHARKYYDHWHKKIAPSDGVSTHTASIGNRRLGDMRVFYREYFAHLGEADRKNPFDGLAFRERGQRRRKRLPLSAEWIASTILAPGALAGLNEEARRILLVVANTGARPGEIANLTADMIVLDHEVPHLRIEPRDDPDDPREIKTDSSIRLVPLVGVALDAIKRHPQGFARYKDKESSLSAAVNKYLRENKLLPGERYTFYSLRHSFEDRMKEARVDEELRRILMGHSIDRPEYGSGGSLKLRQAEMVKVALPYDPAIV